MSNITAPASQQNFAYVAQTYDGQPINGTIEAPDIDQAANQLNGMRLRIVRLEQALPREKSKPLNGADFVAFNEQLAQLASAGLPVEQGLKLIAEDLERGALAQSVRDVSAELERGVSLGDAFKKHEKQFPPLYGALVDAGIRAGNLPAALLNLGRHMDLTQRLRRVLWDSAAYPLTVLVGLVFVLLFLGHYVLPVFEQMYGEWKIKLPIVTQVLFQIARALPVIALGVAAVFIVVPLIRLVLRAAGWHRSMDDLLLYLPAIGPVFRYSLLARWCDALRLGVDAGMDLPGAIELAGDVVRSPALQRDGRTLIAHLNSGRLLDELPQRLRVIPRSVLAVAQLAANRNDLPEALEHLARMYAHQSELRLSGIQMLLMPTLIFMVAILVGLVVLGLFAPMVSLFRAIL